MTLMLALAVLAGVEPASAVPARLFTRPGPSVFRVDVSRHPRVGFVLTAPDTPRPLTAGSVTITDHGRSLRPQLTPLSPQDIELAVSIDTRVPALVPAEQSASTEFLLGLSALARVAVMPVSRFVADPPSAVLSLAEAAHQRPLPPATRLSAALATFTAGGTVRRTIVLALTDAQRLSATVAERFRRELAASGTALYVLDASLQGSPAFDSLAPTSGGFVARIRGAGDWAQAYRRIDSELNGQYYVRFRDPVGLPGVAHVSVRSIGSASFALPLHNPVAPPPPFAPLQDGPLPMLGFLLVAVVITYGFAMLGASRVEPRWLRSIRPERAPVPGSSGAEAPHPRTSALFFVFLLPCLNEEKVIANSLARLLALPSDNFAVMVIDDGSDDATPEVVAGIGDDRVWLLRRTAPEARQGKGEALNAAFRHLHETPSLAARSPEEVILVVVDADGQLDSRSLDAVAPYFVDPGVGAVQIGVRINNRASSRLARMQDMEFVIYTEVFQRGRRHLHSVGLGGNGQFMRLSALRALGPNPWSCSLTEDLDLGVRLLAAGWRNEYCPAAAVHQQGVVHLGRLIRQRSRWFQGHLQSCRLISTVLRDVPRFARVDLLYHLSGPVLLLMASLLTASFAMAVINAGVLAAHGRSPFGWWIVSSYLLAFGPAIIFGFVYWLTERSSGTSLVRIAGLAHLYVAYTLIWYAAGWWAVGRTIRGRTGWIKTERVAEAPLPGAPVVLAGGPPPPAFPLGVPVAGWGPLPTAPLPHELITSYERNS